MSFALLKVDLRDAHAVWLRNLRVYQRLWKTELVAPIFEPVFTFLAFGFGVGALVASQVEGMSYLSFIGAGVLGFTVQMRSLFELTYGAYFRMVYQSTYDAILATPVNVESLAFGEIFFALTKAAVDCVIILIIVAAFGAANSVFAPLAFFPLMLGCIFLGALSLGITAKIYDIDYFQIYFAAFFSTIFLSGAWFPVGMLPAWIYPFAYVLPVTNAIELARACLAGRFFPHHLIQLFYLILVSLVFLEWALRSLRKRMIV